MPVPPHSSGTRPLSSHNSTDLLLTSAEGWVQSLFDLKDEFLRAENNADLPESYPGLYHWLQNTEIPPRSSYSEMANKLISLVVGLSLVRG